LPVSTIQIEETVKDETGNVVYLFPFSRLWQSVGGENVSAIREIRRLLSFHYGPRYSDSVGSEANGHFSPLISVE